MFDIQVSRFARSIRWPTSSSQRLEIETQRPGERWVGIYKGAVCTRPSQQDTPQLCSLSVLWHPWYDLTRAFVISLCSSARNILDVSSKSLGDVDAPGHSLLSGALTDEVYHDVDKTVWHHGTITSSIWGWSPHFQRRWSDLYDCKARHDDKQNAHSSHDKHRRKTFRIDRYSLNRKISH